MATEAMQDRILGPIEVGQILQLHPRTVKRLLEKGDLPGERLGKQWRCSERAIYKVFQKAVPSPA